MIVLLSHAVRLALVLKVQPHKPPCGTHPKYVLNVFIAQEVASHDAGRVD